MLSSDTRISFLSRAALALVVIGLAGVFAAQRFPYAWDDSPDYIAMAKGLPTLMPWLGRILLPSIASFISGNFGLTLDHSFELVTGLSFILWISVVAERWQVSFWTRALLLTPVTIATLRCFDN
jgi:hypothetical protein